jgi:SAM-dependent methyltransferase
MSSPYSPDLEAGVYFRSDTAAFAYNDGDIAEERLLRCIKAARDRSDGSLELASAVVDWMSYYHLGRTRSNLLRPLAGLLGGDVLEVGCGCGALTRYLGETARSVTGVEGSGRRATIAAARCSDLSNVSIYCDHLEHFSANRKFDAVVCVGVIEYSPLFFAGANPVGRMLTAAADHLTTGGYLLIAIENRLGLKYFAGAPEDHMGAPFLGIEDRYPKPGPVTLGRREWERELAACGLEAVAFLYPFPDYKHPQTVLADSAFGAHGLDASRLIRHLSAPAQDREFERLISEEMAWPTLVRNGIAADMANSFLIVVRNSTGSSPGWRPEALAYQYDSDRTPSLRRESLFVRDPSGRLFIKRCRLDPRAPRESVAIEQSVGDEHLPAGAPYVDPLYAAVNRDGWTYEAIAEWAEPWLARLRSETLEDAAHVSGRLHQYTPCHLMVAPDNNLCAFDLEFAAPGPQPLDFVVYRGLLEALMRIRTCAPSPRPAESSWSDAVFGVMAALGMPLDTVRRAELLHMEAAFQSALNGAPRDGWIRRIQSTAPAVRIRRPAGPPCVYEP